MRQALLATAAALTLALAGAAHAQTAAPDPLHGWLSGDAAGLEQWTNARLAVEKRAVARITVDSATTDPTDRSMPPVRMTNVMPTASTIR